jgi:hypothetical protein
MAFTGKATYGAGSSLPEIAEDVSDIVGIVSPFETPLLDHLGDARRAAKSTVHEWVEDSLLPNTDAVNQASFSPDALTDTTFTVDNGDRFRVGDLVRGENNKEVMLVTAVSTNDLTVVRSYGGTAGEALSDNQKLIIIGNAAIEGADRPDSRFTNRSRVRNYTQIFTASVEVSGSQQAVQSIGVADELDYQKQERLRELLRDLENCVINGVSAASDPQGSSTVRRTMNGLLHSMQTNLFEGGAFGFPTGGGLGEDELSEEQINAAMKRIWEGSSGSIDTIVVNGFQKRKINAFVGDKRGYSPRDTNFRDLVSVYESDYGVARVVLSRWVPAGTVLLLDSTRIDVLPLDGRSFHFKPLASGGDSEVGQLIGEYTTEMRNESAHGLITGLAVS